MSLDSLLAKAILNLLRNCELIESMEMALYEKTHRGLSLDKRVEKVEKIYQGMVKLRTWEKR